MSFPWWLVSAKGTKTKSSKRRVRNKPRPVCRPAVEQLEDRLVPSTVSISIPTNLTAPRGGIVTVPINVSSLYADDGQGDIEEGLSGANFVVNYNTAIFQQVTTANVSIGTIGVTVGGVLQTDANDGFKPSTNPATTVGTSGWVVVPTFPAAGQIALSLNDTASSTIINSASGTLININFQVNNANVSLGTTPIDLSGDAIDGLNFSDYGLISGALVTNNGLVSITGVNLPPVANADAYTITERTVSGDPTLTVAAATGLLANDTDAQGFPIVVQTVDGSAANVGTSVALASGGQVQVNSNGSLVYSPPLGFLGVDTFTYTDNDGVNNSNVATVTLNVTARLSIPTNLSGSTGGTVVVPVNIDNPDPAGSGGLNSVQTGHRLRYDRVFGAERQRGHGHKHLGRTTVTQGAGQIGIFLSNTTPVTSSTGGSLVLITFGILTSAAGGPTAINLAAFNTPVAGTVSTVLDAANGPLTLRPAVTNNSNDPNVDGIVAITSTLSARFTVTGTPTSVAAGSAVGFTVTALTAAGIPSTTYTGVVHFSSSDAQAGLPSDYTFKTSDAGVHVFSATLKTAGSQTVTATDATAGITGSSGPVTVTPLAAAHYLVSAPGNATPGNPFGVTVTAVDTFNNVATSYRGAVHFSKSDAVTGTAVPADYTFLAADAGVHVFANGATLITVGSQTITATDKANSAITGSATVNVAATSAVTINIPTNLTVARGGTVTVPINVSSLYANDGQGDVEEGINGANFIVNYNPAIFQQVTASNVSIGTISTGGLTDANDGFKPSTNPATTAGTNGWVVKPTFPTPGQIALELDDNASTSVINSASGTLININFQLVTTGVPLGSTPINLANDDGITSAAIGDGNGNSYVNVGGITIPFEDNVTSFSPFTYVPQTTPNDDGIVTVTGVNLPPVVNADSFSITERTLSSDPSLTVAAANGVLSVDSDPQGFPMTVNTVKGSAANVGKTLTLASGSTLQVNADGSFTYVPASVFSARTLSPTQPTTASIAALPPRSPSMPRRALSIPTNLSGITGGTVVVPVNIDNPDPSGSGGLSAATLAIDYDPTVFSQPIITLGTVTSSWNSPVATEGNGQVGIILSSSTGITSTTGGSLVLLTFGILSTAAAGPTAIHLAATNQPGAGTVTTGLTAVNFALPLRPAVTNNPNPNVDGSVSITSTAATHFTITGTSASVAAGGSTPFTVTALTGIGSTATLYTGTVNFTSSDGKAVLPRAYTFTSGDAGVHVFSASLKTAGTQTLTATDSMTTSITGTSGSIAVNAGAATHFAVSAPASVTAGVASTFSVTGLDSYGNIATGYTGTVHFTKSDNGNGSAVPVNYTFTPSDNGVHTFTTGVTLVTAGSQSITAADASNGNITGFTTLSVAAAAATHFILAVPTNATAGNAVTVSVTAYDSFGNVATGYTGTVRITATDLQAGLPANNTLASGLGNFAVTLKTAGPQKITATDTVTSTVTGTSSSVTVAPATAVRFIVTALPSTTAGNSLSVTVTADDTFGNIATGYTGTVHLSSHDGHATLGADAMLSSGNGVFSVTLKTAGNQTVTATDKANSSITGSQTISVSPAAAATYSVTAASPQTAGVAFPVTLTALDTFGNVATAYLGTAHFSKSDNGIGSSVPPNYTFVGGDHGVHVFTSGVTLVSAGNQTITATDTVTLTVTGLTAVSVTAAAVASFAVSAQPRRRLVCRSTSR